MLNIEISTSSFNGQILWLLVTFCYYGTCTFEVQYNLVFGDHMEPISTVCWLFLQASIRKYIVNILISSTEINRPKYYQYTACTWIFGELHNTIQNTNS